MTGPTPSNDYIPQPDLQQIERRLHERSPLQNAKRQALLDKWWSERAQALDEHATATEALQENLDWPASGDPTALHSLPDPAEKEQPVLAAPPDFELTDLDLVLDVFDPDSVLRDIGAQTQEKPPPGLKGPDM